MATIKNPLTVRVSGGGASVTGIKIDNYSGETVEIASPIEVTASFLPEDGVFLANDYKDKLFKVEWASSAPSAVSVTTTEENGVYVTKVVPIGTGSATITAMFGEWSDSFTAELVIKNTLSGLKMALNSGQAESLFPVGTELPDTYANNDNPLIVGIYENINGKTRVGLVRKYVEPTSQIFNSSRDADYRTSPILNFLQTTYLNNCSDELKFVVAEASIPYYPGSGSEVQVSSKWHLLSVTNVMGNNTVKANAEQPIWPYWQQVTGLSSANNSANAGRVKTDRSGAAWHWWLRSWTDSSTVCAVNTNGSIGTYSNPATSDGVLPICYIVQD